MGWWVWLVLGLVVAATGVVWVAIVEGANADSAWEQHRREVERHRWLAAQERVRDRHVQ